ncbi:hypothetical protein [Aquimarina pacifica]|uniref:hypothetical protein n=1 Tax=Aquimarina pacifica TaxID=1296415 RepID=UPI00046F7D72|nr:hypothetical protein [Aquimarina pacifica]
MNNLSQVFSTLKNESPKLYWIVMINFIAAIGCVLGVFIDDRTLMGINVWIKPLKFLISTGIYIGTVGFLITLYPYSRRKKNIINNIVSWTLLLEVGIIVYQGARGVQSHYNMSTPGDALLYLMMGVLIAINVLIMALFIIDTIRLKLKVPRPIQWSILLGWLLIFFGSWIGGQMINQLAHSIGTVDGGAGLLLVNWSTVAGDLRVAHFFGLHGLQIIPLFALWLTNKWKTNDKKLILSILVFGVLYASWIGFTFYQAKQGMPLIEL